MTDKEKTITNLQKALDSLDITSNLRLVLIETIEYLQEESLSVWHNSSKETPIQGSNILMIRKEEKDTNYPPIAGCFHGKSYPYDKLHWGYYNGFCYNEIEPPVKWAYIDELLKLSEYDR